MKEITIKAQKREQTGTSYSKNLRKKGLVPGVIYGNNNSVYFQVEERQLHGLIYTNQTYIVNVEVDGTTYRCIKQDVQFHPVKEQILHIDFLAISDDKPVKLYLPIQLQGNSIGVQAGGHLYQLKRYLKVKALPKYLPDFLIIDISNLDLGKSLQVKDLKYDNLELLDNPNDLVVMVQMTRAALSQQQEQEQQKK